MAFRRRDMRLAGGEAELNGSFARGSSRPCELPNRKLTFRVHCISLTEHRRQEFRQISLAIELKYNLGGLHPASKYDS